MELGIRIATGISDAWASVVEPTTLSEIGPYLAAVDMATAKAYLVGRLFDDTWTDYDSVATGDAKTISDSGGTQVVAYSSDTTTGGNPIWYDPWYCTDVKTVEDADGVTHIGAVMRRKYRGAKTIQFDAKNTEVATEDTAEDGVSYCGLSGSTYTWLSLAVGDEIPYSSYTAVYRNKYADTNIIKYGHNRYETSAVRQYLNASTSNWWTQKHAGQVAPTQNSYLGYMAGCTAELLAAVKAVKRVCMSNTVCDGGQDYTVCDKFFLPSNREMFGISNVNEGAQQYEFWRKLTGSETLAPSDSETTINGARIMYGCNAKSTAASAWLRSASVRYSRRVWSVTTSGTLYDNYAYLSLSPVPACVIY